MATSGRVRWSSRQAWKPGPHPPDETPPMSSAILPLVALLLGPGPPADGRGAGPSPAPAPALIQDIFGRPLDRHGLVLVDWEGPIANPAIRFDLVPPPDAAYPVRFVIRSQSRRLYFDLPSTSGPTGPIKEVVFKGPGGPPWRCRSSPIARAGTRITRSRSPSPSATARRDCSSCPCTSSTRTGSARQTSRSGWISHRTGRASSRTKRGAGR